MKSTASTLDRTTSRPGLSLVDLVICIAILGIVAGAAAPKFSNALNGYRARVVADQIVADLNDARVYAKQASLPTTVNFAAVSNGYALTGVPALDHQGTGRTVDLDALRQGARLSAINFDAGTLLSFDIHGSPLNSTGTSLTTGSLVVQSGNHAVTVQVDPVTGRASTL
jgi:Tfp pilus assembly protein FimT